MRFRMGVPTLAAFASAFTVAVALAQSPAAAQQPPPQSSLMAPDPSRIVLDVVVTQKSGPTIGGLAQSDFTVLDNGQPQKLISFRALTAREVPVSTLVIIDAVNETVLDVSRARDELTKFLRSENGALAHPMQIAVLHDDGLHLIGGGSIDGNVLAAQLDKADTQLRQDRRSTGIYGAEERDSTSLAAINSLARGEIGRPGRKMVIMLSPGWALLSGPDVMLEPKVQKKIFHDAAQINFDLRLARITLYDVDPLGTNDAGAHAVYYKNFVKGITKFSEAGYGNLGLQVMAEQSGGQVLTESNDIAGEIRRCLADATNYYEISYDVPPAPSKGKTDAPAWHKVDVKMGAADDTARTRLGYYVLPTP